MEELDCTLPVITFLSMEVDIEEWQREALIELYGSTNGQYWKGKSFWLSERPVGDWEGITTSSSGLITKILMPDNNISHGCLTGRMVSLMSKIRSNWGFENVGFHHKIDLRNNAGFSLPADLGNLAAFERLTCLDLARCSLTGSIPQSIEALSTLTELYLHENQLTGSLSTGQLSFISRIRAAGGTVDLSSNPGFSWPIDLDEIDSALIELSLGGLSIRGALPENISRLTHLTALTLDGNNLTGAIPEGISCLTNLSLLDLHGNKFTGGFEHVRHLESLRFLAVDRSFFAAFEVAPEVAEAVKYHWGGWQVASGDDVQHVLGYLRQRFEEAEPPLM